MYKPLYIDIDRNLAVTREGSQLAGRPVLILGEQPTFQITLGRMVWDSALGKNSFTGVDVSNIVSWRLSVDKDLSQSTPPMARTVMADGIDVSGAATGMLLAPVDTCTASFVAAVDGKEAVGCYFQLCGWDAAGKLAVFVRINWSAWGSVDYDGTAASVPLDTVSGSALRAILAAGVETRYSVSGGDDAGHAEQAALDRFWSWRTLGVANAAWSPWSAMIVGTVGPKGDKGDQGVAGPKGDPGATGPKGDPGEASPGLDEALTDLINRVGTLEIDMGAIEALLGGI